LRRRVKEELEEEGDCCITIKEIGIYLKIKSNVPIEVLFRHLPGRTV
jgi:hypothetical protein